MSIKYEVEVKLFYWLRGQRGTSRMWRNILEMWLFLDDRKCNDRRCNPEPLLSAMSLHAAHNVLAPASSWSPICAPVSPHLRSQIRTDIREDSQTETQPVLQRAAPGGQECFFGCCPRVRDLTWSFLRKWRNERGLWLVCPILLQAGSADPEHRAASKALEAQLFLWPSWMPDPLPLHPV